MLGVKTKLDLPIDRIRNQLIQLPCSLSKMVMSGVTYLLEYNYPMKTKGPNIPFDKFAREDLWALSSLRAFLFDEYRSQSLIEFQINQDF